jgi:hypothetical protein
MSTRTAMSLRMKRSTGLSEIVFVSSCHLIYNLYFCEIYQSDVAHIYI